MIRNVWPDLYLLTFSLAPHKTLIDGMTGHPIELGNFREAEEISTGGAAHYPRECSFKYFEIASVSMCSCCSFVREAHWEAPQR